MSALEDLLTALSKGGTVHVEVINLDDIPDGPEKDKVDPNAWAGAMHHLTTLTDSVLHGEKILHAVGQHEQAKAYREWMNGHLNGLDTWMAEDKTTEATRSLEEARAFLTGFITRVRDLSQIVLPVIREIQKRHREAIASVDVTDLFV